MKPEYPLSKIKKSIFIKGKIPTVPIKKNIIKIECQNKSECKKLIIDYEKKNIPFLYPDSSFLGVPTKISQILFNKP